LEKRGIVIHTGVTLESAARVGGEKVVTYTQEGSREEVRAEEIFYALGRRPKLEPSVTEKAGVVSGPVRPTQQTNVDHIFLAGDVSGPYEIVHLAIQQAEVAVRNIARLLKDDPALEETDYRCKLFVLFTHPELAQVGLTEEEAREKGLDIFTASYPFDDHGKSLVMGETDGFVKLVALRSTGEIVGASVLGPEAGTLIHEIVAVMHFHGTAGALAQMPHYHPTLSEIWTYPAEEIADQIV
jgi:pyruvate/2-oxoglutarate dehydrogenase complex dihydrolipoamide dehydrogenase (E3) component